MPKAGITNSRYITERLLGQGGVAEVYLGRDALTGEKVALKKARDKDPASVAAIKREFAFGMVCRHPSLVNPRDLDYENGAPILVLPYIESHSFSSINGLQSREQDSFLAELLETAAFIHFNGFLYNDFKPANYIFRQDDSGLISPALLDFNLVSKIGEATSRRGTIEYTAPEILAGKPPSVASDIYSLGATIFELFAGYPPYTALDSNTLIKMVTEGNAPDISALPERFREGVALLLARDPENRPADAVAAANALGVSEQLTSLHRSRAASYLGSGEPPFADRLMKTAREYVQGGSEKTWLVLGSSQVKSELFYLAREFSLSGWRVVWAKEEYAEEINTRILECLLSAYKQGDKCLLLLDDLSSLSDNCRQMIRALLRHPKNLPVIALGNRWQAYDLPCIQYDPICDRTPLAATAEIMNAFLKNKTESDLEAISEATGGDSEIAFHIISKASGSGDLELLSPAVELNFPIEPIPEIKAIARRMVSTLEPSDRELLSKLSVWGNQLPLILLADLDDQFKESIDRMISGGQLRRGKDSVAFAAGLLRQIIYLDYLSAEQREAYHALWAETAERHLTDWDGLLEISAWHWGNSSDYEKGFAANLKAAKEYQKRSELSRAKTFSEELLILSRKGGGSLATALMLNADILKQEGNYPQARNRYLEILNYLRRKPDPELKSETFKDLGDLYRSLKNPNKALYYTGKALALFNSLGNEQGVANCHNNIGLILWVAQDHENALISFDSASQINERLANFQELAKIQSNIGIIKDILGRTAEVATHFEQAFKDASKAGDPWLEALIANNLGYFYIRQNELDKARGYLQKALEISERIGYTESVINAYSNLGLQCLRVGDLFLSIEYNQKAMALAESIGNRHLSLDARMYMAEVCILMGNFSLANNVLAEIEQDKIYSENKATTALVDLRRSWWYRAIGDSDRAGELARDVINRAESVGDTRLKLEAGLALPLESNLGCSLDSHLMAISDEAARLGHIDLYDYGRLALARIRLEAGDYLHARKYLEDVLSRPGQSKLLGIESRVLLGQIKALQKRYDEAIEILSEMEVQAAGSGFMPGALNSATELGEVLLSCGKTGRGQDTLNRARSYAQRIIASLPDAQTTNQFLATPALRRLLKAEADYVDKENAISL